MKSLLNSTILTNDIRTGTFQLAQPIDQKLPTGENGICTGMTLEPNTYMKAVGTMELEKILEEEFKNE